MVGDHIPVEGSPPIIVDTGGVVDYNGLKSIQGTGNDGKSSRLKAYREGRP